MNRISRRVQKEMDKRYGYFRGEHPIRGWIRTTIETEPLARWLAQREILAELAGTVNNPSPDGQKEGKD